MPDSYTIIGPAPGGFIGAQPSSDTPDERRQRATGVTDSRVTWLLDSKSTMRRIKQDDTDRMKKNRSFYDGDQWDTSRRPNWKISKKLNYCFWVAEQWAAIVTDNKPKAAFHVFNLSDQWQADIASAEWESWSHIRRIQQVMADCQLLASIEGCSFFRLTYDPFAPSYNGVVGDQIPKAVSAQQIFVDGRATNLDDADAFIYEYVDSVDNVLSQFPHLKGKIGIGKDVDVEDIKSAYKATENVIPPERLTPLNEQSLAPGLVGDIAGTTFHTAPYGAQSAPPETASGYSVMVSEAWMKPRGPDAEIKLTVPLWTAGNEPATRKKTIDLYDDPETRSGKYAEPLKIVVMDNLSYEVPMSIATLLQHASDHLGGPHVKMVFDSEEIITGEKRLPLYPNGRRLVVVDMEVADDGMNPFAHGMMPFTKFDSYPNPWRFFCYGDLDNIVDPQDYLNRLYSLLLDAAILTANPIIRLPIVAETADEEITNAPGAIWRETMESLRYGKRERGPDMPAYVLQLIEMTIREIQKISGLQETATGGKFKGQVSSETVSMYQEAAGLRFRKRIRNSEDGLSRIGMQFWSNICQFYTQPRLLRLRDAAGVDKSIRYIGAQMNAPMRMVAKAGAQLPTSPTARLNFLYSLFGTPFVDFQEVLRALEEAGMIDSASGYEKRTLKLIKDMEAAAAKGPEAMILAGWQNPGMLQLIMGGAMGGKKGSKNASGRTAKKTGTHGP